MGTMVVVCVERVGDGRGVEERGWGGKSMESVDGWLLIRLDVDVGLEEGGWMEGGEDSGGGGRRRERVGGEREAGEEGGLVGEGGVVVLVM